MGNVSAKKKVLAIFVHGFVWPPDVVFYQEEEDEGEDGGGEDLLMLNQYGLI